VRLIEPQRKWACQACVDREAKGVSALQESLL
jgi:hypothetical protein